MVILEQQTLPPGETTSDPIAWPSEATGVEATCTLAPDDLSDASLTIMFFLEITYDGENWSQTSGLWSGGITGKNGLIAPFNRLYPWMGEGLPLSCRIRLVPSREVNLRADIAYG